MASHTRGVHAEIDNTSMLMCSDSPLGKLKPLNDDTASTDAGDESPYTDASSSPRASTCEDCSFSDSEASEASDAVPTNHAYPIMLLLQLRASMNVTGVFSARSRESVGSNKVSGTSWSSRQRFASAQGACSGDERVARTARSLLNKLTIEKFDSIFEQLASCGMKTPEHLAILMHEVFEKATLQHHFIGMYADLCLRLEGDSRITSVVGPEGVQQSFQRLLLNQCQIRFEQLLEAQDAQDEVDEETQIRRKQQALGNVKLVGELLVRGMLSSRLFVECAEELLHRRNSCAEALESLATLLMVAGAKFDTTDYCYHSRFVKIISQVRELTIDTSMPARVRFLLRDVLDVRDAGWTTSKNLAAVRAAPMRLEEVRKQAQGELRKSGNQSPAQILLSSTHHDPSKDSSCSCWKPSLRQSSAGETHGKNDNCHSKSKRKKHTKTSSQFSEIISIAAAAPAPTPTNRSYFRLGKGHTQSAEESGAPAFPTDNNKDVVQPGSKTPEHAAVPMNAGKTQAASTVSHSQQDTASDTTAAAIQLEPAVFSTRTFRREVAATLRELGSARNVKGALGRIRAQQVPISHQAKEFADILTRSVEELRNPIRRLAFAFVAGLAAGEQSAFDRRECFEGLRIFFDEVYSDLCDEVPRLPTIVTNELIPTLGNVFPQSELSKLLPRRARA